MFTRSTGLLARSMGVLALCSLAAFGCGDDRPATVGGSGHGGVDGGGAGSGGAAGSTAGSGGGAAGTGGEGGTSIGGSGGASGSGGGSGVGGGGTGGGSAGASGSGGGGTVGAGATGGDVGGSSGAGGSAGASGAGGTSAGTAGSAGTGATAGSAAGTTGSAGAAGSAAGASGSSGNAGSTAGAGGSGAGGAAGGAGTGGAGGCQSAADCPPGQICDTTSQTCGGCADDHSCLTNYGSNHICVGGLCVDGNCHTSTDCSNNWICADLTCVPCQNDIACESTYGPDHLCVSGSCINGQCRTAADCQVGQICTSAFACTSCSTDPDCVSAYGANHLCVNGACISGDCRTTADCGGGRICDTSAYTCTSCTDDPSCVAEYGPDHLCVGGSCISGNCRTAANCAPGQVCDANAYTCRTCASDSECVAGYGAGHLCENGTCITGECRTSPECPNGGLCNVSTHSCGPCATDAECVAGYGNNHLCVNNACVSGTCHTTADCGGGQICDMATFSCVACPNDAACVTAYGPQHLCIGNVCVSGECRTSSDCTGGQICDTTTRTCHACTSDPACSNDPAYGASTVCVSGGCQAGDCHGSSADCPTGQLCGITTANTCGGCTTDAQCTSDSAYGPGNICYQGICQPGNCHGTSADCTGAEAGLLCGASAANTCGACATDTQCQTDTTYGSTTICNTTTGMATSGQCVSGACSMSGACAANGNDFCCSGTCTAGNCCVDADCAANPKFGSIYRCVNNSCTGCSAAVGNKYFVDPIGGNDATATGSGMAGGAATPSCSFRTVTRALQVVGSFAVPGTQIVIVGQSGMTVTLTAGETLPIVVPANVTIATKNGPIRVNLPASSDPNFGNVAGFQLGGDLAGLAPDPSAPLTIDGGTNTSGIGIGVSPGSGRIAALSYVVVQNTGGHGIAVSNGSLLVGPGVNVSGAGTASKRRDGLNVAGGSVAIAVATGQAPSTFNNNTQHGIYVTGAGVVNISGVPVIVPAPNGQGTVQANGNVLAGLRIFEAPGVAALSSIDGLVAWGNAQNGLRLYGGAKVRVRNGVFLANTLNGVFVTSYDGSTAGNDLSQLDFGTAGSPGRNDIQALVGSNPDLAGLCISMSTGMGTLGLTAQGNVFAGPTDCAVATSPVVRSSVCGGYVDLGIIPATGTTVTVDVSTCH